MFRKILNQLCLSKKIKLPEKREEVLHQYIDVMNTFGYSSREARAYYKATERQYPEELYLLKTATEVKAMFAEGDLE